MDSPSQIRRDILLVLLCELDARPLSDSIAVKEWLERKLAEPTGEDELPRCTNHYLCQDRTRWDAEWSCLANDRCPTCDAVVEPYATTRNADGRETIHNQEVYNRANVVKR